MTSLNPVLSIGRQMIDIQHRERRSLREKRERAADMLARVGITDATSRPSAYPHQFSGGMRQRIAIAMAPLDEQIGRASSRERVSAYVLISVVGIDLTKKHDKNT